MEKIGRGGRGGASETNPRGVTNLPKDENFVSKEQRLD